MLIVLASASTLQSPSPQHAQLEVYVFAGLVYVCQLTATLWSQYRLAILQWMIYAILLGAVIYMVGFYTGYLASFIEAIPLIWPEPFFGFSNIRAFNQYQAWTLALVCLPLLGFNIEKPSTRRWIFAVLASWWVLLFASASRGLLLAWLVAMLVTAWCYRQIAWPLLRLQLASFITGLSFYGLLFHLLPSFLMGGILTGTVLRDQTDDRISLWKQAGAMIHTHPWFGVGPMHYAWYPNAIAAHPHNSILQLAAEWGLPATLIMLSLAGYGIFCWLKQFNSVSLQAGNNERNEHLAVVLFFTLVANACYSLVDGVIVMPLSQLMMAVVLGLMLGLYNDNQLTKKTKHFNFIRRLFAAIVLIGLVWSVLPELLPRLLGNEQMIPKGYQTVGPRFWQEGGIIH
ncbi:MAG: O-antigen ligase family protein [Methylococcaceae bacterium]|nr:O-antigen ligase family protein [Methylococcaceae bacterium]MDP3389289.1 O-antigen ligase family protein [Methylococcaceae bacterium]MDP3932411.1 O-antigen ligase family protein [Methylococcaceae bacterium]MDZ4155648.1 O-antigen ligase family protein [Methylococcales bacterium]